MYENVYCTKSYNRDIIFINNIDTICCFVGDNRGWEYQIKFKYKNEAGNDRVLYYNTKNDRDDEYYKILELMRNKGETETMIDSIKSYLKKNEEVIITIAIIVILDQVVFGGAFREKLKSLVESLINKVSKKVEGN